MANLLAKAIFFLSLAGIAFGAYPKRVSSAPKAGFMKGFLQSVSEAKRHLVSAAVARSTSILGLYPVDTIKVRISRAVYLQCTATVFLTRILCC